MSLDTVPAAPAALPRSVADPGAADEQRRSCSSWATYLAGMHAAAAVLGITSSALHDALTSGCSLASLAHSTGVDRDALLAAIGRALCATTPWLAVEHGHAAAQRLVWSTDRAVRLSRHGLPTIDVTGRPGTAQA